MWNTFENSKLRLEQMNNRDFYEMGLSEQALKEQAKGLIEKYKNVSVSRTKAELIRHILENSGIDILPDEIFASRMNHAGIVNQYRSDRAAEEREKILTDEVRELQNKLTIAPGMDFGHIAPDWQYVLDRGIPGIIADLETCSRQHADDPEKADYYAERIMVYTAMRDCLERFAHLADNLGTEKSAFIAGNLRRLSQDAPETLAQALQLILFYYVVQVELDRVIVRSLGGLDRMLCRYFRNDLDSGRYTRAQLGEIVDYFLWKISCMQVAANLPFYICGMDDKGNDASNEFTYFLLERYRRLDIYDPKIHVMYHENMDEGVLRLILEMIREGKNSFVFMNTKVASEALMKIGVSPEDAKRVIVYGCYETAAEATEIPCTCAGMINLAAGVEMVMKRPDRFDTFEAFKEAVISCLEGYTMTCMDVISAYEKRFSDVCPSLVMSPTYLRSRTEGVDVYSGGAKYNNTSIVGIGLATLADSLDAVRKLVYEEKRATLDELREILLSDWRRDEKLRLRIRAKYPKFGNNNDDVDRLAVEIHERFADLINGRANGRGGVFRCGMFSVDWRLSMGEKSDATPDGRYAGDPLSKNLAASVGQDKNGVTAYLQSVLKLDGTKTPDGYVADVVLHCSAVKDEEGMVSFRSLLTTFMKKGGFSVHFNILSPEMLVNAQKEPEKYRNLQIRLCGWNVRFVDLDKAQQDEFIKQSENVM